MADETELAKERRLREEEYQIALHIRQEQHAKLDTAEVRVRELTEALERVRDRILDPKFGGIDDTFWMAPAETVVDYINAALARSRAEGK